MKLEDFNTIQKNYENFKLKISDKDLNEAEIRMKYPYIFNSWRSIKYTQKGKKAGNSDEWNSFMNFFMDVFSTYEQGKVFRRKDTTKPFSKDNFIWLTPSEAAKYKGNALYLDYNGETHNLYEWAVLTKQTIGAIKNRYYKHKNDYSIKEIIFGKEKKRKDKQVKDWTTSNMNIRTKASKMISAYKFKDKKLGFTPTDIDIDWFITNIITQKCIYCGDSERIGADRIDNDKPHSKDNIVPCCYDCNCARNNNFTHEEMLEIGKSIAQVKAKRPQKNDKQFHSNDEFFNYQKRNYNPIIYQYNSNMELIKVFNSVDEVLQFDEKIKKKTLLAACRGQRHNTHFYYGFNWFYEKQ